MIATSLISVLIACSSPHVCDSFSRTIGISIWQYHHFTYILLTIECMNSRGFQMVICGLDTLVNTSKMVMISSFVCCSENGYHFICKCVDQCTVHVLLIIFIDRPVDLFTKLHLSATFQVLVFKLKLVSGFHFTFFRVCSRPLFLVGRCRLLRD